MKIRIVQTRYFTKEINRLIRKMSLSLEDFEEFKNSLKENPRQGDVITGTGGIRKTRLKSTAKGKRGGFRVCYFYYHDHELFLIYIYPKNEQENLTAEEKKLLKEFADEIKKK